MCTLSLWRTQPLRDRKHHSLEEEGASSSTPDPKWSPLHAQPWQGLLVSFRWNIYSDLKNKEAAQYIARKQKRRSCFTSIVRQNVYDEQRWCSASRYMLGGEMSARRIKSYSETATRWRGGWRRVAKVHNEPNSREDQPYTALTWRGTPGGVSALGCTSSHRHHWNKAAKE